MKVKVIFVYWIASVAALASTQSSSLVESAIRTAIGVESAFNNNKGEGTICLEIGRLDAEISGALHRITSKAKTFQDQRKDKKNDPVLRAHERTTALLGFCGELSGQTVAGYRFMPRLAKGDQNAGREYISEIISDLRKQK